MLPEYVQQRHGLVHRQLTSYTCPHAFFNLRFPSRSLRRPTGAAASQPDRGWSGPLSSHLRIRSATGKLGAPHRAGADGPRHGTGNRTSKEVEPRLIHRFNITLVTSACWLKRAIPSCIPASNS